MNNIHQHNLEQASTPPIYIKDKIYGSMRKNFFLLIISPVTSLFLNFINLFKTIYASRILFNGQWNRFLAYDPAMSCLRTFYLIQARNILKYGLNGFSPTIGHGISLKIFFYHNLFSLYAFKELGIVLVIFSLFFWAFSFLIWIDEGINAVTCLGLLGLSLITSNFCGNLFYRQNYNALGWAISPLVLWALFSQKLAILIFLIFLTQIFSITAFLCIAITASCYIILTNEYFYFVVFIIPALKILLDLCFYVVSGNAVHGVEILKRLLGFIGVTRQKAFYKRKIRIGTSFLFSLSMSFFPAMLIYRDVSFNYLNQIQLAIISLVPVILTFINQANLLRFADVHSLLILNLTLTTTITILANDWVITLAFWLVNSNGILNIILCDGAVCYRDLIKSIPASVPFDFSTIKAPLVNFLTPIQKGQHIFVTNSDPKGNYNALFDGYLNHYQALTYCADYLGISVSPDWFSIMYKPTPYYWAKTPEDVKKSMQGLQANYCLLYFEKDEASLLEQFYQAGFEKISELDWSIIAQGFAEGSDFKELSRNLIWVLCSYAPNFK